MSIFYSFCFWILSFQLESQNLCVFFPPTHVDLTLLSLSDPLVPDCSFPSWVSQGIAVWTHSVPSPSSAHRHWRGMTLPLNSFQMRLHSVVHFMWILHLVRDPWVASPVTQFFLSSSFPLNLSCANPEGLWSLAFRSISKWGSYHISIHWHNLTVDRKLTCSCWWNYALPVAVFLCADVPTAVSEWVFPHFLQLQIFILPFPLSVHHFRLDCSEPLNHFILFQDLSFLHVSSVNL